MLIPTIARALLLAVLATPLAARAEDEAAARQAGHERMLALLAEISEHSTGANAYLGAADLEDALARLESLAAEASWAQREALLQQIAFHELRLGLTEAAIEHIEQAVALLEEQGASVPEPKRAEAFFALGVAQLRLGETQNCCQQPTAESCILPLAKGGLHSRPEGSRAAMQAFSRVLELAEPESPLAFRARWLLNIAAMTLGEHPDGVPEALRIPLSTFGGTGDFPRFRNAAPSVGLDTFDLAGGAVVDDLDGDGRLDVMTSTSDCAGPMHFFHNRGDGTFEDKSAAAGLAGLLGGLSLCSADYDNDGDLDVLVLRGAWWGAKGRHPNSLLQNDGAGRFLDVSFAAGFGEEHYPTQAAGWADYDLDGDLDLYVGNESGGGSEVYPSQLFRNDGAGRFTDVARAAGVENLAFAKGVAWGDFDGDLDPDLYVSNMGAPNRLYRNKGDGSFVDIARATGVLLPSSSFGCWFFDCDDDGALDLVALGYGGWGSPPDVADVAASYLGHEHKGESMRLYMGNGRGKFREVAADRGLGRYTLPMGCNFGDLDGDLDLDVYLGTGYPDYQGLIPNVMYLNEGAAGFRDVSLAGGFAHLQKGHGVVFADLDDDGDVDLFEQMGGAFPGDRYANALFENPGFGAHWIKLRLVGQRSNRAGIGARLALTVGAGESARTIYRHVGTGASFGCNPRRQEIGLGPHEVVAKLEVLWPASGLTQTFENVAAGRMLEITEGQDELREIALQPFALRSQRP